MNISSYTGSVWVNPNACSLTTNPKNAVIMDRERFNGTMQRQLNPMPPMVDLSKTPLKLAAQAGVNRRNNSVTIAEGQQISVNDDYVLNVTKHGVEVRGGYKNPYDQEAFERASNMASSLTQALMAANGYTYKNSYTDSYNESLKEVMSYIGINTSKDFTVNGMKFGLNKEGNIASEADNAAREAYEIMIANNRTYHLADQKTKGRTDYMSDYYLRTVPDDLRTKWQETLEETNINPFQHGAGSTLTSLCMEQDFATGGNDNLFGDTQESFKNALSMILERIDNPKMNRAEMSEDEIQKREAFLAQERIFYTKLAEKIGL